VSEPHPVWICLGFLLVPVGLPLFYALLNILVATAERIRYGPQKRGE
jgi:hypothetical protein